MTDELENEIEPRWVPKNYATLDLGGGYVAVVPGSLAVRDPEWRDRIIETDQEAPNVDA